MLQMNEIIACCRDFYGNNKSACEAACILAAATGSLYGLKSFFSRHKRENELKKAIGQRQADRNNKFATLEDWLNGILVAGGSEKQKLWEEILGKDYIDLQESLQSGTVSVVEVLHAYQRKALEAHKTTNCLVDVFLEAEERARVLDQEYAGKDKPPLFGIPFSVKECLQMKDYDCTGGLAARLYSPVSDSGVIVDALISLGAIPFVHTNVPQTMMSIGCFNPIYGTTGNPENPERTSGGSSGGEAALAALRAAPFGLGSDIAGSIRHPAHNCGIYGIKPCMSRMSAKYARPVMRGIAMLLGTYGPMAPSMEAVVDVCRHLWSPLSIQYSLDPYTAPLLFREEIYRNDKPLTIGYYVNDGFSEATPACIRAVEEATIALRSRGHKGSFVNFDRF